MSIRTQTVQLTIDRGSLIGVLETQTVQLTIARGSLLAVEQARLYKYNMQMKSISSRIIQSVQLTSLLATR